MSKVNGDLLIIFEKLKIGIGLVMQFKEQGFTFLSQLGTKDTISDSTGQIDKKYKPMPVQIRRNSPDESEVAIIVDENGEEHVSQLPGYGSNSPQRHGFV